MHAARLLQRQRTATDRLPGLDWIDERRYVVHLYVTQETVDGWIVHHFAGKYRAATPDEIARLANQAGLQEVCVLPSSNTGFYQPIIVAEAA